MSDTLNELDIALYSESWEWLNTEQIPIANIVKRLVDEGKSPETIRRRVLAIVGQHRSAFATRCENAAKYLYAMKVQA